MSGEALGIGTTLGFKNNGGYTDIARLESIGDVSLGDVEDVAYVCYDSPDNFREHMAGIMDAGEFDIAGIWTADASQTSMDGIRGVTKAWKITLPSALGVLDFDAYLSGPKIVDRPDDKIGFTATVRITGPVAYT